MACATEPRFATRVSREIMRISRPYKARSERSYIQAEMLRMYGVTLLVLFALVIVFAVIVIFGIFKEAIKGIKTICLEILVFFSFFLDSVFNDSSPYSASAAFTINRAVLLR